MTIFTILIMISFVGFTNFETDTTDAFGLCLSWKIHAISNNKVEAELKVQRRALDANIDLMI